MQDQGKGHKLWLTGLGGERNAKLRDVIDVEIGSVEAVADVQF